MEDITKVNEHFIKIPKYQSTPKEMVGQHERKSLQTLQASPNGSGLNGGKDYVKDAHKSNKIALESTPNSEKDKLRAQPKVLSVFHDPSKVIVSPGIHCSRGTQTHEGPTVQPNIREDGEAEDPGKDSAFFDQEAFDLMANEEVPEAYWKDLAEERRRALEESLEENRRLSLEIDQLKKENSRLMDVEQEARELRELLENALTDDDEDSAVKIEEDEQSLALGRGEEDKMLNCDSETVSSQPPDRTPSKETNQQKVDDPSS